MMIFIKRTIYCITGVLMACGLFGLNVSNSFAIELTGPSVQTKQTPPKMYGPIAGKDTLWRIAFTNRQDPSQSVDQVMIAIFMANPEAFLDNNINLLKDGSMLVIPNADDTAGITRAQAQAKIAADSKTLPLALTKLQPQVTPVIALPTKSVAEKKVFEDVDLTLNSTDSPLTSLEQGQLSNTRNQLDLAMNDMQLLIDENKTLREQIDQLTEKLDQMKVQDQLDKQLKNDHLLLQQELELIEQQAALDQDSIFNNGWFIAAIASVPSIAILAGMMFWLSRKRPVVVEEVTVTSQEQEQEPEPEPEIEADLSLDEDELDDTLDDDLLISDDGEPTTDESDDTLDGLDAFDDELLLPDDAVEEIILDDDGITFSDEGSDDIISAGDIDALLAEADALEDAEDGNQIIDNDDIDALLAQADELESDSGDADQIVSSDDIDALLAQVDELESDASDADQIINNDDIDALLAQADELESDSGDADQIINNDDIDALLAQADELQSDTGDAEQITDNDD
ncbi:MAG: hypothetical protein HRU22_13890, partial [Gammaproteobacteria bacterium]|nr:hypothetical protein [Gammaproteobacteria bacterium]